MVAQAFHDGERTAIAHGKAFSGLSGHVQLPGGCAIENGVADKNVAAQ